MDVVEQHSLFSQPQTRNSFAEKQKLVAVFIIFKAPLLNTQPMVCRHHLVLIARGEIIIVDVVYTLCNQCEQALNWPHLQKTKSILSGFHNVVENLDKGSTNESDLRHTMGRSWSVGIIQASTNSSTIVDCLISTQPKAALAPPVGEYFDCESGC